MRVSAVCGLLALVTAQAAAEVTVRVAQGRVDLTATAAPLADVLDRLARQTGMKVVYEGPAPRQLVTVSLHGRTPAETVLAVFEGLGLNYALVADPSGASVQTLMVAGTSTTGTASPASSPAAGSPAVRPNVRRSFGPPPGSSPEATEPAFDEGDQEADPSDLDFTGLPPGADPSEAGGPAPTGPAPGNVPVQGTTPPPGAGVVPTPPSSPFSASPFTPQPQPFLPAPPGAATGANPPQSEEGKPQAPPPQ